MNSELIVLHPAVERRGVADATDAARTATATPAAEAAAAPARSAPATVRPVRRASLDGARIALLDNSKLNSDRLLAALRTRLAARYAVADWRAWRKNNSGRGATFLDEVVAWKPDLVINGIGD